MTIVEKRNTIINSVLEIVCTFIGTKIEDTI